MSQFGLWHGALTQAQIQEVMEQTYDTMTPSIKSTLGAEMITNSDMEEDTTYWYAANTPTTEEQSDDFAHSGTYSWHIVTDGSDEGVTSRTYTTVTGKLYKVTMWTYLISSPSPAITVREGDGSGTAATFGYSSIGTGAWTKLTGYYVETAGGTGADLNIRSNAGGEWYIDDVSVKEVTNDLVGYWGLDDSTEALIFDGTGDYVNLGTDNTFYGNEDLTLSCWVKTPATASGSGHFISRDDGTTTGRPFYMGMHTTSQQVIFRTQDSGGVGKYRLSTATIDDDNWHHIVGVFVAGTSFDIYVDGSLSNGALTGGDFPSNMGTKAGVDTIISGKDGGSTLFTGDIAQVAIYNKALTSAEVTTQYNLGIEGDYSSDSGLVGYWKLDTASTSSNAIVDLSTNSNHGTVAGNPTLGGVVQDSTSNNNDGTLI